MILRGLIFLVLNFGALGIGGLFTGPGVSSNWYQELNKAPWTPPGWVFGAAWTFIMLCLTVFMTYAWTKVNDKKLLGSLFAVQWVLNIIWNPIFFHYQHILIGLVVIASLTLLLGAKLIIYRKLKKWSLFLLPYVIWLLLATSLNAYIFIEN